MGAYGGDVAEVGVPTFGLAGYDGGGPYGDGGLDCGPGENCSCGRLFMFWLEDGRANPGWVAAGDDGCWAGENVLAGTGTG